jgi:TolB-like protein
MMGKARSSVFCRSLRVHSKASRPLPFVNGSGRSVVTKPISGKISVVVSRIETDLTDSTGATSASNALGGIAISDPAAIRRQLTRMLGSRIFVHSEKLSRFLRFIVEHAIGGTQNYLKEYVIGSEVYDRRPPYHPTQDSIVRTEARRLRSKLKEYYQTEGKDDPVYINLRPGSYIPVLQYKKDRVDAQSAIGANAPSSTRTATTTIAILPFRDISGRPLSAAYARGIPDELAYALMQKESCRVISPVSMAYFSAQEHDVASAMSKVGAQIAFEGSVREEDNHIRVTATIVDAAGFQLWTRRLDADVNSQTLFALEEQIASELSEGLNIVSPR